MCRPQEVSPGWADTVLRICGQAFPRKPFSLTGLTVFLDQGRASKIFLFCIYYRFCSSSVKRVQSGIWFLGPGLTILCVTLEVPFPFLGSISLWVCDGLKSR